MTFRLGSLLGASVLTGALLTGGCAGHTPGAAPSSAATSGVAGPRATPSPASPSPPSKPKKLDRKGLTRALDGYLKGRVSGVSLVMVDRTTGYTYRYRPTAEYVTASAVKIDIRAALLLRNQRAHRSTSAAQRADADVMIRYSDNKAADRLYTGIGGVAGLDAANRKLKLRHTHAVEGRCIDLLCWSLTRTTADDQIRLMKALVQSGPLNAKNREYVLGLMGRVSKEQSWGVRAAARQGDQVANKNGWMTHQADGDRWAINSIGRVQGHGHDFLVAVLTEHNPSEGYGITTAEHVVTLAAKAFRATTPWIG
jgi:hypothetical protein